MVRTRCPSRGRSGVILHYNTKWQEGIFGEGNVGICKPFDGQPARAGNGVMIAFVAPSQDAVRAAHAAGLANGGSDEGAPGMRPPDGTSFFGAYLRDPTGNKLCIFNA